MFKIAISALLAAALSLSVSFALADDDDDDDGGGGRNRSASPELIAARQKVFGVEHVDTKTGKVVKDKVIFSWLSNSSFAASIKGRVVLLDTFVTRLEVQAGRVPFVIKDLVDLKPEAILLGHGHNDHADNAAYIAAKTGAVIYASEETCPVMHFDLERMKGSPLIQDDPVARIDPSAKIQCVNVTSRGSVPGTELLRLDALNPQACVVAFRHLHSVAVPPDPDFLPTPVQIIVDPRDATLFPFGIRLQPNNPPQSGQMDLRTGVGFGSNPGGPVSLFFYFIMRDDPNFTVVWHNTAGALKEGKGNGWDGTPEDGARLIGIMKDMPAADVQMGTASSGNFNNNGLRDLIMYQQALRPKIYVPNHVTSGTATREASSMSVYAGYLQQLKNMEGPTASGWPGFPRANWPSIRWLIDPTDYIKPIVFDPKDAMWRDRSEQRSSIVRHLCGIK